MPVENREIIFFLNVDALADMLVYDENHSPEMIKGRGKYQLPNIPNPCVPRASPQEPLEAEGAELLPLGLQAARASPSLAPQPGTATLTHLHPARGRDP